MLRKAFLSTFLAFGAARGVARATGGLDVGDPGVESTMRVLLRSDAAAEQPARLDAWRFSWRGRTYRGDFTFVPLDDGRTALVNVLPLDAYLYGVVSKEVSALWPEAALQAQAVVSRTYALGRLRPTASYDVTAGESSQAYGGIEAETVEGRAAVDATAGSILTFGGAPASIAYGACCGGHSASASDVWGTDFPYLRGVADPHCSGTPGYAWRQNIPLPALYAAVGKRATEIGDVRALELLDRDDSERPRQVALVGRKQSFEMKSEEFRSALGTTLVRSTLILCASIAGEALALEGRGFGHGVGLCQWGARVLGESGAACEEILQFYFPGTELGRP